MKHWSSKTLGEVCQFSNGLWKGEKPPFVNVGVIRNTNFTKEGTLNDSDIAYLDVEAKKLEKRRLQFGDIILEKSGGGPKQPVGRVILFDKTEGNFSFSNFTAALRVLDPHELDFRFLHEFLHWTYLSGITEGMQSHSTGIRNLDTDAYKAIKISFPPLPEQKRIVGILNEAGELRKLRAKADHRIAELIPALFHDMFGDPVSNPKQWPRQILPELCEGKEGIKAGPFGSSLKKDCYTSEGPRVYGQEQVIAGDFSIGNYHISEAKFSEMLAYVVKSGDLLISLVGTIGKVIVVPDGIERGIINPRLLRVRPRTGLLHPCYLAHVLTSPSIIQFLGGIATGITMGVLNAGILKKLDVPLPPFALQKEFAQRVIDIRELEASQATSRTRLDDLFQSMLHRAFNGEL
jgi:type I restriction enzyme S subunit